MVPPTANVVINENVSAELPQPSTTSLDEHDPVDNGGEDLGIPLSCSSETDDDDDEEIDHDVRHIIPSFQPTPLQTDLPFWSACPHFTAVNWGHPDQEQLIPSDTADHGEWKMGDALYKGLQFDTKDEVKAALACYSMNNFQSYVTKESRPTVLEVVCDKASSDGCPWVMRANTSVRTGGRWIVKKWDGPHTCFRTTTSQDHNKLSSKFVSTYILGMVKNDPSIAINMIQERVCSERRFQISYRKAWKAKQMALATVFGNWKVSYDLVNRWLPWMITKSQGSVYELQTFPYFVDGVVDEGFRQFRRLFWTFKPVVDAFNWCKPVIQIDGTFLYGKYKGTLLIATTQDGNDCVLPIAFALVEAETLSDWMWFLQNIRQHVTRRQGICLISDRHASIKSAVARSPFWQPPHAYHVYCIRHIASNFNHKFHAKALKEQLIRLGYLTSLHTFTRRYEKFCETSPEVKRWIEAISIEKWSLAHDTQGRRYGHMTTNLSEAVNKIFKGARHLPITALVKCTYERLVSYYLERGGHARAAYAQGQHYSRKLIEAMEKNQAVASTYIVKGYDVERTKFDVQEPFNHSRHQQGETWTVNLAEQTCQCGAFQAYKYPCSHAVAACAFINVNHYQYVDRAYSIMSILSAYSGTWNPLGNEETMPERSGPIIIPDPSTERRKGRPRSTRIRNEMDWPESQQSQTCRHCKAQGHNRRRCPQLVANSANNS